MGLKGKDSTLETQYLTALAWSLAQFSGGMDEVVPVTAVERFFAVLMWLITFTLNTVLLANLTANMTQQYMINGTQSRQLATLRKYLKQNGISANLGLRMNRSARHAISGDLTQDAVELMPVITENLRIEMHFEIYKPVMRAHPFIAEYIAEAPHVMRRVCHYATGILLLSATDAVFNKGEVGTKMYFIFKGSLEYVPGEGQSVTIADRSYIAEAVLWTRWIYKGTFSATNDSKLASLEAKTFQDIVDRFNDGGAFDPKVYAADFVSNLNKLALANQPITDLTRLQYRTTKGAPDDKPLPEVWDR